MSEDDFSLSVAELMFDAITCHETLFSMDCIGGYNRIQMALEDQEVTAFCMPRGTFCYKVMPLGVKDAKAT